MNVIDLVRDGEQRFWEKVERRDPGTCWTYTAYCTPDGYGRFTLRNGNKLAAHQIAFVLANGYLPEVVRHTCDNPPCCNSNHLIPGTHDDNMRDMVIRGRSASRSLVIGRAI